MAEKKSKFSTEVIDDPLIECVHVVSCPDGKEQITMFSFHEAVIITPVM